MLEGRTTLTQFIIEEQRRVIGATGDFTGLLSDIATACKVITSRALFGGAFSFSEAHAIATAAHGPTAQLQ